MLEAGIWHWVRTSRLNTSKLAVVFNKALNVCLVCKSFMAYRDVFLLGLSVAWSIEVPDLEQVQVQSEAAFQLCTSLQELECAAATGAGGHDNGGVGT